MLTRSPHRRRGYINCTHIWSLYHDVRAQCIHIRLLEPLHQIVILHVWPIWSKERRFNLWLHVCHTLRQPVRLVKFWPAEKMLMAMSRAYSASSRCRSFIPFENSKMGLMNSNWSPKEGREEREGRFRDGQTVGWTASLLADRNQHLLWRSPPYYNWNPSERWCCRWRGCIVEMSRAA